MSKLNEFITSVRKRLDAATPGPWAEHTSGHYIFPVKLSNEVMSIPAKKSICDMVYGSQEDRELIASAPTDLKLALEIIEIQQRALEIYASPPEDFREYGCGCCARNEGQTAELAASSIEQLLSKEKE